jgi:hypothetical protein
VLAADTSKLSHSYLAAECCQCNDRVQNLTEYQVSTIVVPAPSIRPADAPFFIAAQFASALAATFLFRWLVPNIPDFAHEVIVPHKEKVLAGG